MKDEDKTKEQLINELVGMRQQLAELYAWETKRKGAEAKLRESEEKYRTIFESANDILLLIDKKGKILDINEKVKEIGGYEREELVGKNVRSLTQILTKKSLALIVKNFLKRMAGFHVAPYEVAMIKKDGELAAVEVNARALRRDGRIIADLAILRDITQRKRMEEEIRLLSSAAEHTAEGIFMLSRDGIITYANIASLRAVGWSRDEAVGKHMSLIFADPGEVEQAMRSALRDGHWRGEYAYQRKSGRRLAAEGSLAPIRDDKGNPIGVVAAARDVTERKRMEEALTESEEKYRSLVNHVKLGIFRSTSGRKGRFLEVNPAMEEITGYSREELLQIDVSDLYLHPEQREMVLSEVASGTGKATKELLFKKKDGTEIAVSDTKVAVRDDAGNVMYFDGILEDITARKILGKRLRELYETEKRQREELEEEQKARTQFINILAHELKTPLTPLIAGAALLKHILTFDCESREYRLANLALNGARTLASRLDELLELARLSVGAFSITLQSLDIRAFCEEITSGFQPLADEKGHFLILDMPQALPVIKADRSRLEQVLMNLLSNASKFSLEGGNITVRTRVQDSELMIEVEDQGIGIAPEEQERIFKPYHRAEQDRQRFPGLGLGLAVSKEIVQALEGRMWVSSQLGQGSTFGFSLPLNREGPKVGNLASKESCYLESFAYRG